MCIAMNEWQKNFFNHGMNISCVQEFPHIKYTVLDITFTTSNHCFWQNDIMTHLYGTMSL